MLAAGHASRLGKPPREKPDRGPIHTDADIRTVLKFLRCVANMLRRLVRCGIMVMVMVLNSACTGPL